MKKPRPLHQTEATPLRDSTFLKGCVMWTLLDITHSWRLLGHGGCGRVVLQGGHGTAWTTMSCSPDNYRYSGWCLRHVDNQDNQGQKLRPSNYKSRHWPLFSVVANMQHTFLVKCGSHGYRTIVLSLHKVIDLPSAFDDQLLQCELFIGCQLTSLNESSSLPGNPFCLFQSGQKGKHYILHWLQLRSF